MKQFNNSTLNQNKFGSGQAIEQSILNTLRYFFFFNYPPTLEEIHTFLKKKTSKRRLTSILQKMEKRSLVRSWRIGKRSGSWLGNKKLEVEIGNLSKNYFLYPFTKHASIPPSQFPASNNSPARYTLTQYASSHPSSRAERKNLPSLSSRAERPKGAKSRDLEKNSNSAIKQFNHKPEQVRFTASNFLKRQQISINKLSSWKFRLFLQLVTLAPSIKLVGLSGSVAMLNADEDHDLDLFIITGKNRLWTGRFIALLLTQLLGIRRSRHSGKVRRSVGPRPESLLDSGVVPLSGTPQNDNNETMKQWSNTITNKVCLNLFFDESDLAVPKFKRSEYVAHEVLQMKPLVCHSAFKFSGIIPNVALFLRIFLNRDDLDCRFESFESINKKLKRTERSGIQKYGTYLRFIDANRWVFDIFPNTKNDYRRLLTDYHRYSYPRKSVSHPWKSLINKIESILKKMQLYFIRKHQTTEIITENQLWFHPDDFAKKVNNLIS